MTPAGQNRRGALLALAAFAIFASHDAAIKLLGSSYSTFQIVFFATLLGFPLATFMLMGDNVAATLRPRHPVWMVVRSLAIILSGLGGFYAFSVLPLAQTYAILFATPLLITILAIPILGEKVGMHRIIAVVVGLAGVLIVLRPGQAALGPGHLAALISAGAAAMSAVVSRRIGADERTAVMVLYPMMGNFIIMGLAMPFVYQPVTLIDLGLLTYVAVCAFTAMLLIVAAYRAAEAVIVAPMQYSQIIWATLFGALIFDETPRWSTFAGAAVVIASGLYIVLRENRIDVSDTTPVLSTLVRPETGPDRGPVPPPDDPAAG